MTLPERPVGRPLTGAELDRLETLLDAPAFADTAMRTDALHGFLTAVASAPVPIAEARWLAEALGNGAATDAERDDARALLRRLYGEIALSLVEGHGVDPLVYAPEDGGEPGYGAWCEGYLAGVALADPPWDDVLEPDEAHALLAPFAALALEDIEPGEGEEAADPLAGLPEEERARFAATARERLPDFVQDAYDALAAARPRAEPLRRDAPKIGRNDPCPCGSGKKYKRCCGAG
jgi:uncharacterized protein